MFVGWYISVLYFANFPVLKCFPHLKQPVSNAASKLVDFWVGKQPELTCNRLINFEKETTHCACFARLSVRQATRVYKGLAHQ